MKFKIWHDKINSFGMGHSSKFPESYDLVAVVEADNLDDTFRITNHIHSDWTKNDEVIKLLRSPCRSTSVGDIVEDEDGVLHYCDMVGWKVLETA